MPAEFYAIWGVASMLDQLYRSIVALLIPKRFARNAVIGRIALQKKKHIWSDELMATMEMRHARARAVPHFPDEWLVSNGFDGMNVSPEVCTVGRCRPRMRLAMHKHRYAICTVQGEQKSMRRHSIAFEWCILCSGKFHLKENPLLIVDGWKCSSTVQNGDVRSGSEIKSSLANYTANSFTLKKKSNFLSTDETHRQLILICTLHILLWKEGEEKNSVSTELMNFHLRKSLSNFVVQGFCKMRVRNTQQNRFRRKYYLISVIWTNRLHITRGCLFRWNFNHVLIVGIATEREGTISLSQAVPMRSQSSIPQLRTQMRPKREIFSKMSLGGRWLWSFQLQV